MNKEELIKLKSIIKNVCRLEKESGYIEERLTSDECDLKEELGFDSLLFVELVVQMEDEFGIEFDVDNVSVNKLRYFGALKELVNECLVEK